MFYNYHNRLRQLLESELYIVVVETGEFAYRFIFPRIMKSMPIRDYRVEKYRKYIKGVIR